MTALEICSKILQSCSIGARSELPAGHGSVTAFWFVNKSPDKRAAVLA